jgi:hypothetical protein
MDPLFDPRQVGWFVARQPHLVRQLATQLAEGSDAYAVALDGAWRLAAVFERRDGVPPRRLTAAQLDRARRLAALEGLSGQALADGGAARQPELCRWVASFVADPPIPIDSAEAAAVGKALIGLLYALDEATQGEPVALMP